MRVTIVLPGYNGDTPIGGFHVHFKYANLLAERGHRVSIVFPESLEAKTTLRSRLGAAYRNGKTRRANRPLIRTFDIDDRVRPRLTIDLEPRSLPDADVLIATAWTTAEKLSKAPRSKGTRFYVLYDYEHWRTAKPEIRQRIEDTFEMDYRIVATSSAGRAMLATRSVVPAEEIHCGLDFDHFAIDRAPEAREPLTLGFPSRDGAYKGTGDAIDASLLLREKFGDSLRITTFGRRKPDKHPLPDFIEWLEFPSQARLRQFYNDQAVFLLPSHFEGWGLPAVEAMACGAAVVVTENGGSADFAIAGETALVVPPGDVAAIVAAVERLLTDHELRLKLARNGHRFVQRFCWESSGDALDRLIRTHATEVR